MKKKFYGYTPPSADSRRVVVSYKRKYVLEVLVNCLGKLAQESVVRLTERLNMTKAVVDWDVKPQTPQKNTYSNLSISRQYFLFENVCFLRLLHIFKRTSD